MARFSLHILISLIAGWWIGVGIGWTFWPDSNFGPLIAMLIAVPLIYAASFLIVPLLLKRLDRLR